MRNINTPLILDVLSRGVVSTLYRESKPIAINL